MGGATLDRLFRGMLGGGKKNLELVETRDCGNEEAKEEAHERG